MTLHQSPLEGLAGYRLPSRTQIVQELADFRREWQKAAQGQSLIDVEVSVGLILIDIADRLRLSSQERHAMLGGKLINEANAVMEQRVSSDLSA
jgi:hypothetical protein